MSNPSPRQPKIIASVQRALDILNLFEGPRTELGNAEIAKLLNLAPGTAAGLIHTLKVNNYLDQNMTNRKYRLGMKLVERGAVLLDQLDLRKIAAVYLEELCEWSGESVNLGILNRDEVVYIERIFGMHALGIRTERGKRAPIHSTALGKAIVAFQTDEKINHFIATNQFFPVTRYTITDPDRFIEELHRVQKCGFALDEEENEIGGRCVAAPIFDHDSCPVAAVSISVPIQRLPREKIPVISEKLKDIARSISYGLGYPRK